ncbi:MAG: hypothetical protein KTR14_06045 [Vampirovibrio sp.]|nr:hypothetical protein [Vampirovibrio sp.]
MASTSPLQGPEMGQNRRWYDQQFELGRFITSFSKFPTTMQLILAEGIIYKTETDYGLHDMQSALRSLGKDKVMALHKSKSKLRGLDQQPTVHTALNHLFILPPEYQSVVGKELNNLVGVVTVYLTVCRNTGITPEQAFLSQLTNTHVARGPEAANMLLEELREETLHVVNLDQTVVQDKPTEAGKPMFVLD